MLRLSIIRCKNIEKAMDASLHCQVQTISKIYLTPNYGVANLFKMLTYSHVCSAFSYVTHDAYGVSRLVFERNLHL